MRPLLEFRNVSFTYELADRSVRVLNGLSFYALAGSLVCVAGRSGSGKTTALTIAAGLQRCDDGEVLWSGEPVGVDGRASADELRRAEVLLIPQHGGMIPSLTAVENVLVAARPDERHRLDRALECLQTVKLETRARHFPTELSSGERQRVALARALMRPTAVVLVDEPTANLDRQAADELISLLRTLPDEGRTLVAASHDPNLIARADAVIRLE